MILAGGAKLLGEGRFQEALAAFAQALRQAPDSVDARMGLAHACLGAGDPLTAAAWLSDACRLAPDRPAPHQTLAELLLAQQLHVQALPLYQRLCSDLRARDRTNLLHCGLCLEHTGAVEAAAHCFREALAQDPRFMEAHVDLAGVLWRLEDFNGALAHARRAVELAPTHPFAVRILGTALLHLHRVDEAERALRRALELQPGLPLAELDLAFTLLLAGRLGEGWALYERRWHDPARARRPAFYQPDREWKGPEEQPLDGKTIAIYAEQGFGDVLQFVRFLPRLQAMGATVRCILPPELVRLVEASFEGIECLRPEGRFSTFYHAALLDLPLRLGIATVDDVPRPQRYLQAPEPSRRTWGERMRPWAGRKRIGIAWSGTPTQVNNRNRAVPLSVLGALLDLPGAQCFSLQKAPAGSWTDVRVSPRQLVDLTVDWHDFADSAAMIEQLDLVITTDTAVAHLAGALGRPVWVLLPPNADWRWLLGREDSPWYPTARLFRRAVGESRQAQVQRVVDAARTWLAASP